jgi:hypothetical protein
MIVFFQSINFTKTLLTNSIFRLSSGDSLTTETRFGFGPSWRSTSISPKRRTSDRTKWSYWSYYYQDWGTFLADSAGLENCWSPFFNLFGRETMTSRIIYQWIVPDQSYLVLLKDTLLFSSFRLEC